MRERPPVNWKLAAVASLLLPLVMVLLRQLWPDIAWGFLLLFGLQVMLMLAALLLVVTSIWGPGSRWNLPSPSADSQRRIFAKKDSVVAQLQAHVQALPRRVTRAIQAPLGRLFQRKTP